MHFELWSCSPFVLSFLHGKSLNNEMCLSAGLFWLCASFHPVNGLLARFYLLQTPIVKKNCA